jgi:CRP-like cAMP-binding protein
VRSGAQAYRARNAPRMALTEVSVINETAFLYLEQKNPGFARGLMRRLAERLHRMDASL